MHARVSYDPVTVRPTSVGSKRICVSCATRFYDLERTPPVCPKCGTEQPPQAPRAAPIKRGLRMRPMRSPGRPVAEEEAGSGEEAAVPEADDDEDDEAEDKPEVDELEEEAPEPDETHS